jgi:outer membrane receptor protein involved in Fe transport
VVRARWTAGVALALAAWAAGSAAYADERAEARQRFRAGIELVRQGQYLRGVEEFQAAYRILPNVNVLYNIARAYADAGEVERAIEYTQRYLAEDVPDRAAVEAQLRVLEERRRQRPAVAPPTPPPQPPAPPTGPDTPPVETPPIVPAETAPTGPAGGLSEAQILALRQAAQTILRVTQGAAAPAPSAPTAPASQPTPSAPPAQPPAVLALSPRLAEVPREDAYEERVVTATLAAQSPLDAPNATSVITAQDIRLSGLTNLGELLRRAVGVDVMSLESTDTQVGIRGFNRRLSNRVMVLLDGRSVYLDFLGVTFWSLLPVAVEEIERIEIIRGPGSALYGADAFSGVVNIITRAPGEGRNSATVGVGNALQLRAQATNAGRSGRVSYRLSAGYEQAAGYARLVGDDDRTYRVNARDPDQALTALRADLDLRAQLPGGATLRGGAAFSNGSLWFSAIGPLRRFATDLTLVQPWAELRVGGFTARAYTNHVAATAGEYIQRVGVSPFNTRVFQDVFDVELRYARTLQAGPVPVDLTLGASYRGKYISWSFLNADHLLHHFAGYAQGVARFGRRLSTVASLRVDRHPVLDAPVFSPRLAVIYRPTERRAVRLSGSTAFRTPTMLELYLDLQNPTPLPGVGVRGAGRRGV